MADLPVRARIDDKELDRLIAKLRQVGKEAELSEQQIREISSAVRKSVRTTDKEVSTVNSQLTKVTNKLAGIAQGFILAFATDAIKRLNGFLEQNLVRLEAIDRRASVVFGRYKQQVEDIAKSTANNLGLSESAFIGATAAAADLLVPMGFARGEAAALSVDLVKLSGALAEWTGGQRSATEVSQILIKSLLGEREQLKELGISILEADVQARLLEKGQKKLTGQALEQAKALATLELVTEKSADAQTAFAESSDSLGRTIARRDAAIADLSDSFSELLAPAISTAAESAKNFFELLNDEDVSLFQKLLNFSPAGIAYNIYDANNREDAQDLITDIKTIDEQITDLQDKITQGEKEINFLKALGADEITRENIDETIKKVNLWKIALKQLQDELATGEAEENQVPLLTEINNQLDVQRKLRNEALTEEDLAKANRNIQLLEEELKRLKEIGQQKKNNDKPEPTDLIDPILNVDAQARKDANELKKAVDTVLGPNFLFDEQDFKERGERIVKNFERTLSKIEKANKESLEKRKQQEQDHQDEVAALKDAGAQLQYALLNTLSTFNSTTDQQRLNRLQQFYDRELELAGDNEAARKIIERKREEEEKALLERQARRDQRNSLFQLAISEGPAIGKTAAQLGFPLAIPFIAAIGTLFAIQFSKLKSLEVPRYAKGKYKIKGPGTETSDEIPAMLSLNETVLSAEKTNKFGWLLQPMVEDASFTESKLKALVDKRLPSRLRGDLFVNSAAAAGESRQLSDIKRAIEQIPGARINLDKNGFSTWVGRNGKWNEYVNERYRV